MIMFKYLKEVINNGRTGKPSSSRFVMVASTLFMGVGLIIITIASCLGQEISEAIWAFTIPMSMMAGVSYSSVEISKIKNPLGLLDGKKNDTDKEID
jgi:hypothetical protein